LNFTSIVSRGLEPSTRRDRLTVAAIGGGGLLMSLPELDTVVRLRPRLLVAV
jgi:thiamine pyrophosphate-dependent acetolactate synthase large subunit-like protein